MIEFRAARVDDGDGAALAQAMRDEIAEIYEGLELDGPDMPKAGPDELGPPGGTFLVGDRDGQAVCCGGVKRLPDGTCEIKKMYVIPSERGKGVARELGYTVVRLDTGPKQPGARHLYESEGYAEIDNFNGNPVATFFAEKAL